MIKRFGWTACLMLAANLLAGPAMAAANGETYKTRLSVVPLDVGMQATVAGQGSVTATLAGNKLTVSGTAEGLRSPATVAHIHRGAPGIPGPAILDHLGREIDGAADGRGSEERPIIRSA